MPVVSPSIHGGAIVRWYRGENSDEQQLNTAADCWEVINMPKESMVTANQHKHFKFVVTDGEYEVLIQTPEARDAELRGAELEVILYHGDDNSNVLLTTKEFYDLLATVNRR